jgi:hypothetical protein
MTGTTATTATTATARYNLPGDIRKDNIRKDDIRKAKESGHRNPVAAIHHISDP